MKSLVSSLLGALCALGVVSSSVAQQLEPREPAHESMDVSKYQALPRANEPRNSDGNGVQSGYRERLSLEERRQLRRDINAAGRDIYRRESPGRAGR